MNISKKFTCIFSALIGLYSAQSVAQDINDYISIPPTATESAAAPMVMLAMSRDNQLWHKAYNDYSDLNGDNVLDITYDDAIDYYGNFISNVCYTYENGFFAPDSPTIDPEPGDDSPGHGCNRQWSGNFLNWLTATRMDVLRKVLYGGLRRVDTASSTIIERAFIPADNHAFVKLVANDTLPIGEIDDFTPFFADASLSFCSVTDYQTGDSDISGDLDRATNPPLLKVASGRFFAWSGSERNQCQYIEEGGNGRYSPRRPAAGSIASAGNTPTNYEFIVRTEVCSAGFREEEDGCREYTASDGSTSFKPSGLLQTYGETGRVRIGLMSGSWGRNAEGGVLRKNVSLMGGPRADEGDIEINTETGQFINQDDGDEGIINTLNRFQIQGWDYGDTHYDDCDNFGISEDVFLLNNASANRECKDWGNPIAEIYTEALRYISGRTAPTPLFDADDSALLGIGRVDWEDPYTEEESCADCSIILLSTGLNNYDGDDLGFASIGLRSNDRNFSDFGLIETWTDDVGDAEGLDTGTFLIGRGSAGGTEEVCDAKSIEFLSEAAGLCPENPTLEGTYNIAGAAFYAKSEDLRPDIEGEQTVDTFTVSLAETLPTINIQAQSGLTVSVVPMCRANIDGSANLAATNTRWPWTECSLVDLTVGEQSDQYGHYIIGWEDSSWGNDYDLDVYQVLEYCTATGSLAEINAICDNIGIENSRLLPGQSRPPWVATNDTDNVQFRVAMVGAGAGNAMKLGYAISGAVTRNGGYEDELLRRGGYNGVSRFLVDSGATDYAIWSSRTQLFEASVNSPGSLESPLWYAAKYGGFTDQNDNGIPDLEAEWDRRDSAGALGSDGDPDSFFEVRNPALLETALETVFNSVSRRVSSGSAAAINPQTGSGEGAVYQALYVPTVESDPDSEGDDLVWTGYLHSLFIDRAGRLREDQDPKGTLGPEDAVIQILFNEAENETFLHRYVPTEDGSLGAELGDPFLFSDPQFSPIWSAEDQLGSLTNYTSNRAQYQSNASGGRYIFTAIDRDGDGNVIDPDVSTANPGQSAVEDTLFPFVADNFENSGPTADDFRFFGVEEAFSTDLVNFIRGDETIVDARSRTANGQRYLLGDIIHSTPAVVSVPDERYDVLYKDNTYADYIETYQNRRNVVYVGANDGMLHAFNAGFFNSDDISFNVTDSTGTATPHPLGSELWAYVPYNVLPHLKWLASPTYEHVYFVDGPVQAFDVNIFTPSAEYPGGWGTIIVVGTRYGARDYSLDHDGDSDPDDVVTLRSSYIVFDVTNPERPPELLAEITHPDLGLTTTVPTIVKSRKPDGSGDFTTPSQNTWHLVFGSGPQGPDALSSAISDSPPSVFTFDLINLTLSQTELEDNPGVPEANGFIGGFDVADWDTDFDDDAVYFGLVAGTIESPQGKLKRGELSYGTNSVSADFSVDLFSDSNQAFSAVPRTHIDGNGDRWIFAGTGRFFVPEDNTSTEQQTYFGIKDSDFDTEVAQADLVNTTDVDVFEDGRVFDNAPGALRLSAGGESEEMEEFDDILEFVSKHSGWYFNFESIDPNNIDTFDTANLLARNTTRAALAGNSLVISAYEATGQFCTTEGSGLLYTPHLAAGAPAPFAASNTTDAIRINSRDDPSVQVDYVLQGSLLGPGIPSDPIVTQPPERSGGGDEDECDKYIANLQVSTGELKAVDIGCEGGATGRQSWREIPVNW